MSKIFDALKQAELASRSRSRLAETREKPAQVVFVIHATDSVSMDPLNEPEGKANEGLSRHGTSLHLIWFFLVVLLTSATVIFLRHYARGVGDDRQATEITSAGKVPAPGSTFQQSTSALPATLSSDLPGFVLQVAAMKHEDNADALAETLHRRNFPAFVFKRGAAGPFYRVAIGVYGDAGSAVRVKVELERQGFKAILKRWLPE